MYTYLNLARLVPSFHREQLMSSAVFGRTLAEWLSAPVSS